MTTGAAIHVRGLEKSYKELRVLRGVDFDVARGSIFALLGSNGAGKTTTVNILSTLLRADAGTASVNGFDVAAQAAHVRESISLTGQFAAVDEILTGRENLVLVARLRHLATAAQNVAASNRWPMTADPPASSGDTTLTKIPSTWNSGSTRRLRVSPVISNQSATSRAVAEMLAWSDALGLARGPAGVDKQRRRAGVL
jgi:ABC-type sugar transport system ATPase subunit